MANDSFGFMSMLVLIHTKTDCVPKSVPRLPNTTTSVLLFYFGLGATLLGLLHSDSPFSEGGNSRRGEVKGP